MKVLLRLFLWISKLPLWLHYGMSDILYFLNYYLIGYRKKVVRTNLQNAFPEKSKEEISKIQKEFYRNFTDYLVETVKLWSITERELRVRVQHINQNLFQEAKEEGKNVILLAGHVFNWEWISALATSLPQSHSYPVYRKINNSFWDQQILKIRNRFQNQSLEDKDVIKHILSHPNDGDSVYMFVADQSPHHMNVDKGLDFLNQETPVFIGYDKLATRKDLIFIYCEMKKVKRGYYQINYKRIYPEQEHFVPFEVVQKFHHLLENTIQKRPANYLWSHRRWKYQKQIKSLLPPL
ncbi:lysophospholipid acyltransferase family protein [Chryseobacterium sp. A301]